MKPRHHGSVDDCPVCGPVVAELRRKIRFWNRARAACTAVAVAAVIVAAVLAGGGR